MNITFKADIINAVPTPNKLAGLFGVFNTNDSMVGAWDTRKQAQEWINSWVFEGQDVSHWTIRKISA